VPRVLSVNLGAVLATEHSDIGITGIDKRPAAGPVELADPGLEGGRSGAAGDHVCDARHHGGRDQAVYAFAREDLDEWAAALGRTLPNGVFGENLTTSGLDLSEAVIGERWQVGGRVVLEVSAPRIPCRTFAGWLGERGWVKTFTQRARPGTYLRVLSPGQVAPGDPIRVLDRPSHGVTVALTFRALTTAPELLGTLLPATALPAEAWDRAARHATSPGKAAG
jgi:MOSC domain-containing protein YiiM